MNEKKATPDFAHARGSKHGILLWLLTFLFLLRVLGQLIQYLLPQSFLPDFNAFQGSSLPYWLLLSMQLVIFLVMARYAQAACTRRLVPSRRAGNMLLFCGGIYMLGSMARIVIGLTLPSAPAWFSTWIPAVFHLVLAGYVLVLASYHRQPD